MTASWTLQDIAVVVGILVGITTLFGLGPRVYTAFKNRTRVEVSWGGAFTEKADRHGSTGRCDVINPGASPILITAIHFQQQSGRILDADSATQPFPHTLQPHTQITASIEVIRMWPTMDSPDDPITHVIIARGEGSPFKKKAPKDWLRHWKATQEDVVRPSATVAPSWANRELPLLRAIAKAEERGEQVGGDELAAATGLSVKEAQRGLRALHDGRYIEGVDVTTFDDEFDLLAIRLLERGRREIGQWPSTTS